MEEETQVGVVEGMRINVGNMGTVTNGDEIAALFGPSPYQCP